MRTDTGWHVAAPAPVGDLDRFVRALVDGPPTLAGFDFPIGLPAAFGRRTGLPDFRTAFAAFGQPWRWQQFLTVARTVDEVAVERPFYPDGSRTDASQAHYAERLGLTVDGLRRRCERQQPGRRAASPLFWTVGPAQVGKAAISGWRDVVRPALARGARLWPFDGPLNDLARSDAPVLCETYPAEAYRHVGIALGRGSKRRLDDRRTALRDVARRSEHHRLSLSDDCRTAIGSGFPDDLGGEDGFDALAGLLGMIEVADGRRSAMPAPDMDTGWEGWILGQDGAAGDDG